MPTILSCTDGSIYANSLYDHTAWAAQKLGASVHLLHLLDPELEKTYSHDLSGSIGLDARAELMNEIIELEASKAKISREKGKVILKLGKLHLEEKGITDIQTEQRHGSLTDSIDDYQKNATLLVIGKRGENADFTKMHLGSNLERLIRNCSIPVLVASREFQPIQKYLFLYDASPSANKALEFAANHNLLKGIKAHVVYIGKDSHENKTHLQDAVKILSGNGTEVSSEILPGSPENIISDVVKKNEIDLLIMGAYGHSRFRELLMGSTTSTMIKIVHKPVLLFR